MNRLYVIEPTLSTTGAMADHRLAMTAGAIESVARTIASRISSAPTPSSYRPVDCGGDRGFAKTSRGASLVIAGDQQPPAVHALVHEINHALGNVGKTVFYTDPVAAQPVNQLESLRELVDDMRAGAVDLLVMMGGNPVYDAPVDFGFAGAMDKVKMRVRLGLYEDETSRQCHWHIPEAHYLETWGDARAFDGTATIQQPLIAPLYGGKSGLELLAALLGRADQTSHDLVRAYWRAHGLGDDNLWHAALHDGVVPGTVLPEKTVTLRRHVANQADGNRRTAFGNHFPP